MTNPRSAPPDLPGFTYEQGIGGGGFADVFLYTQHRPNRKVAVKVLRAENLTDATKIQFDAEADLMAEVSAHPYIVTIFSVDLAPDGRPCIVMEYYPNSHFGVRAKSGELSVAETLRVGVQVACAVETAHRAGIYHRDIKPANILTSAYGRPGLTDFGISAVQTDETASHALAVSIGFAPPEVLDEREPGTEVADVYSLCATLYTMLAGHSPFWSTVGDNTEQQLVSRVLRAPVPAISRSDVPVSLSHLLANGMAKDPTARPRSAVALARSLQDVERELRLAPTPLEVRDDVAAKPRGNRVHRDVEVDEEEGTRLGSMKVVHPEAPPVIVAPRPASPPLQPPVAAPVARAAEVGSAPVPLSPPAVDDAPSTAMRMPPAGSTGVGARPADRPRSATDREPAEETILRAGASVPASVPAAAPVAAPVGAPGVVEEPETGRKRTGVLVAAAVVVLVAAVAVGVAVSGGSGSSSTSTTTTIIDPDAQKIFPPPGSPSDVSAQVSPVANGTATLHLTWTAPTAEQGDHYKVVFVDGVPPESLNDIDGLSVDAQVVVAPGTTELCPGVEAVRGGIPSAAALPSPKCVQVTVGA